MSDQELERQKQAFYGARDAQSARAALAAYEKRLTFLEATIRSGHSDRVNAAQQGRFQQRTGIGPVTPLGGK